MKARLAVLALAAQVIALVGPALAEAGIKHP
jgi:hypothetical protein